MPQRTSRKGASKTVKVLIKHILPTMMLEIGCPSEFSLYLYGISSILMN